MNVKKLGVGNHYSIATLVFFIPYVVLGLSSLLSSYHLIDRHLSEIPSNIVFRRVGASRFLGTIGL
jgi:hypothetical protein